METEIHIITAGEKKSRKEGQKREKKNIYHVEDRIVSTQKLLWQRASTRALTNLKMSPFFSAHKPCCNAVKGFRRPTREQETHRENSPMQ